jgi:5-hydroxyisourate hydrolase
MGKISTHVLDISRGTPGSGLNATLEFKTPAGWVIRGSGTTGVDGRIEDLHSEDAFKLGLYRLTFDTDSYFRSMHQKSFFPQVVITFEVSQAKENYHLPLLLNTFGYTTYRGS